MRRPSLLIAAVAAACVVLAACGASESNSTSSSTAQPTDESSSSAQSSGGTAVDAASDSADPTQGPSGGPGGAIVSRISMDAGTLDPALATADGQMIDTYLYDPLVNIDMDGNVVSGIAEEWQVAADSATFTLRDDVTCSSGHVITASDVKATYDYLANPDTHATWIVALMSTTDYTVTADDAARAVTISLPAAYGDLISGISAIGIVCPDGLADPTMLTAGSDGTGPFVVDSVQPDVQYTLKKRDGYRWGPDGATNDVAGYPASIQWKVVKDDSTAVNMFARGELNLLAMNGSEAERLGNDPAATDTATVASTGSYMVFNQLPGRLLAGNAVLREALAKATNRQDVVQVATGGLGRVTDTLVNMKPSTCDDSSAASAVPTYDVDAAKKLLDDNGWTVGADGIREKDGVKLSLTLLANDDSKSMWEYLQQAWSTELGVDAKLEALDNNTVTDRIVQGGDWDVSGIRIATNMHSVWTQFFAGPVPPDGLNLGSGNGEYEKLATHALVTPGQAGCDLWTAAEASAFGALDVFPLYVPEGQWFGHNVQFTPISDGSLLPLSLRTTG